ncbi:MAG: glycosyltransferase family 2 protein [Chitinophagaceae bacterium]|nr:glycosyltransferase family 2 protein [Chitinophagaceae bacterium]
MKVSGFTFVRNAVKYGYPVVESISSILPLVDEMIVCLGDSDDETRELIGSIGSEKIRIIESVWDIRLWKDAGVLAVETNKALDATATDSDWLFYIQADEVVHEKYHAVIKAAMQEFLPDPRVEGLVFLYHHFYGSYRFIADGRKWYSRELRVIRNDKSIRSYRDAQGFRWKNGKKLAAKEIDAYVFHYGWVRDPGTMQNINSLISVNYGRLTNRMKTDLDELKTIDKGFNYAGIDVVVPFNGTHPLVMKKRVDSENWETGIDPGKKKFRNLKHVLLYFLWKRFGWRPFEYRNYIRI